jgi:phosphatidylserine decarboxylase
VRIPIHPAGWPFIGLFLAANVLLIPVSIWTACALAPLTLWCIAFFRDPERTAPEGEGLIISAADGRLLPPAKAAPPPEIGLGPEARIRLSVFMNVFDVHVNRIPLEAAVAGLAYRKGRFFNASFDKASEHNERMSIRLRIKGGAELGLVQIAGLIARRIRCDLTEGEQVRRGERFGIIRFGSRVDLYLPPGTQVMAKTGARVRAGETVLAKLPT